MPEKQEEEHECIAFVAFDRATCNADLWQCPLQCFSSLAAGLPALSVNSASVECNYAGLLEPDKVLHPLDPAGKPSPVRCLIQLLFQSGIVFRLAFRMHERVGERVALAQGVVQEQVCGVDFERLVSLAGGCCLNALLKEALEVSLCWAKTVGGPAC